MHEIATLIDLGRERRRLTKMTSMFERQTESAIVFSLASGAAPEKGLTKAHYARAAAVRKKIEAGKGDEEIAPHLLFMVSQYGGWRSPIHERRKAVEAEMAAIATSLPVWAWWSSVRGAGPMGLASAVGLAGDFGAAPGPATIWNRLGLSVNREDSSKRDIRRKAQRSTIFGDVTIPLFMQQSATAKREIGPYRLIYDEVKTKKLEVGWAKGHAHQHGLRVMTKTLLRDLWRAWRQEASVTVTSSLCELPAADLLKE